MRQIAKFGDLMIGDRFYYFAKGDTMWQKTSNADIPEINHHYIIENGPSKTVGYSKGSDKDVWINITEDIIP